MIVVRLFVRGALMAAVLNAANAGASYAQSATDPTPEQPNTITCESREGERQYCPANTSPGVALVRTMGTAPCLLGKTWGYDDGGIDTSDGCSGEFIAGQVSQGPTKTKPLEHIPNLGFLLYDGEKDQIYFRLFSYVRYLNQRNIDASYTDFSGVEHSVQQRQDIQLAKSFSPFAGWFLTPKFRYYLYVWSSNASQGDPAQVVGAGNLSYTFNRFASVGAGITSLPTVRSTEGQFLYWIGVDGRLIADEFFRGSCTNGVWLKGDLPFGNYDYHEKAATRVAVHWSHSLTPDLFGKGVAVNNVDYRMMSIDAGITYRGLSLEDEYYRRWFSNFAGVNTGGIAEITDNGYQLQSWDGCQRRPAAFSERVTDLRSIRRFVRGTSRRELVLHEAARTSAQHRVHPRQSQPGRLHPLPDAGRGQRQHLPHQSRDELLRRC